MCDVYNQDKAPDYSRETFQRAMLYTGWLDHFLELCGSHGTGVWLPVLLCHPRLVHLLCILGAGTVERCLARCAALLSGSREWPWARGLCIPPPLP